MKRTNLALTRERGQTLHIGTGDAETIIEVIKIGEKHVRLLVQAPEEVKIMRGELLQRGER